MNRPTLQTDEELAALTPDELNAYVEALAENLEARLQDATATANQSAPAPCRQCRHGPQRGRHYQAR